MDVGYFLILPGFGWNGNGLCNFCNDLPQDFFFKESFEENERISDEKQSFGEEFWNWSNLRGREGSSWPREEALNATSLSLSPSNFRLEEIFQAMRDLMKFNQEGREKAIRFLGISRISSSSLKSSRLLVPSFRGSGPSQRTVDNPAGKRSRISGRMNQGWWREQQKLSLSLHEGGREGRAQRAGCFVKFCQSGGPSRGPSKICRGSRVRDTSIRAF